MPAKAEVRTKGYSRASDIPAATLLRLETGLEESLTLTEISSINLVNLIKSKISSLSDQDLAEMKSSKGILKKMRSAARAVTQKKGLKYQSTLRKCATSDTLRGIGAFMIGAETNLTPTEKIELLLPYANDPHFGVREWAWMAIRDDIVEQLPKYLQILEPLSKDKSPYTRRFCVESIRPKGVWATHIKSLKSNPDPALKILKNLYKDESRYVQDSVANWMNDLHKDNPEWVLNQCRSWEQDGNQDTQYIVKRAQRNIQVNI